MRGTGVNGRIDPVAPESGGAPEAPAPWEVAGEIAGQLEQFLICALVWSPAEQVAAAGRWITADDFWTPSMGRLFELVCDLARQGRPHQAPMVMHELERGGDLAGADARNLIRNLTDATLVGAPPEALPGYVDAVLSAAYRRSYRQAAERLAQIAEQAPESRLFELLVDIGTGQRTAWRRLQDFRTRGVAEVAGTGSPPQGETAPPVPAE